ncbi:MAG: hypothetical protein ACTSRA_08025 [Promethearchaeota archaeon]
MVLAYYFTFLFIGIIHVTFLVVVMGEFAVAVFSWHRGGIIYIRVLWFSRW